MKKLKVFLSYSHKDAKLLDKLDAHMSGLRMAQVVDTWTDGMIKAGDDWRKEIMNSLMTADVILLLISSDFLKSDFCRSVELKGALERHETDRTLIIPILLRPCDIKGTVLEKFQCIPKDAKPVTEWSNRDRAFVDIVERIRTALSDFEPVRVGAAASQTSNVEATLKRVFGQSEFQSPIFFEIALRRSRAVARLESNGTPACTGCLVRLSDFGLSSNSNKDQLGLLSVWYSGTDLSRAFFERSGFQTELGAPIQCRLGSDRVALGAQIFILDNVPPGLEPCPIGDPITLQPNEPVAMISHPLGGPLALSIRDTRFVAYGDFEVSYHAATQPGSSGGPVFDSGWNMVAIHSAKNNDGSKRGLSITAIRDALIQKTSPLAAPVDLPHF